MTQASNTFSLTPSHCSSLLWVLWAGLWVTMLCFPCSGAVPELLEPAGAGEPGCWQLPHPGGENPLQGQGGESGAAGFGAELCRAWWVIWGWVKASLELRMCPKVMVTAASCIPPAFSTWEWTGKQPAPISALQAALQVFGEGFGFLQALFSAVPSSELPSKPGAAGPDQSKPKASPWF